jgi:hypothetical protein
MKTTPTVASRPIAIETTDSRKSGHPVYTPAPGATDHGWGFPADGFFCCVAFLTLLHSFVASLQSQI